MQDHIVSSILQGSIKYFLCILVITLIQVKFSKQFAWPWPRWAWFGQTKDTWLYKSVATIMHGLGRFRTHGCMQVLLPVCMVLFVMCVPILRYKLNDVGCSMGQLMTLCYGNIWLGGILGVYLCTCLLNQSRLCC